MDVLELTSEIRTSLQIVRRSVVQYQANKVVADSLADNKIDNLIKRISENNMFNVKEDLQSILKLLQIKLTILLAESEKDIQDVFNIFSEYELDGEYLEFVEEPMIREILKMYLYLNCLLVKLNSELSNT